jgi:hypothetical protein
VPSTISVGLSSTAKKRNISHTAGALLVDSRSTHTSDCIQAPKPRRGSSGYGDGAKPGEKYSYRGSITKFLLPFGCFHLPNKVIGSGNVRVLPRGDLSFVYYTKARFFSNPKAHVRNAAVSFSFACHKTTGLSEEIQVRGGEYPVQKEQIAGWVSECKLRKKQRSQLAAPNTKKGALRRRQVEKAVGVKRERQTI